MPLRHLVFIEIRDEEEKIALIHHSLNELSKKVQGCFKFNFGKCSGDSNYHYFFMDFDDEECRDKYLAHPEHEKMAKEIIIPNLKNGLKSAIVFDYSKTGQKNVSRLKESKGMSSGYILIKAGQESRALYELGEHFDKIKRIKPLVNCSTEELGKEHLYAMRVRFKKGVDPVKIKEGTPFWTKKDGAVELKLKYDVTASNTNDGIIESKL